MCIRDSVYALSNGDVSDDLGWPLTPQITQIFAFFVAFHIISLRSPSTKVLGERRDFKFGIQVDRSYREQNVPERGVVTSRNPFLPRDSYAKRGICRRRVSVCVCVCLVCLSVCVSVTVQYCIMTAKHGITQTTPHDSPMTLVFWWQRSWRNSHEITPYGGDKCRWGGLKLVTFDEKRAITRKRYKIDV